jgi:gamma-glutamylcyclotransferase (GGCT)/AIG2-like uncharacterized protein YtfP
MAEMAGHRLFVYASLLAGQPEHHLLAGARFLGRCATEPCYALYDLGPYGALVAGGQVAVSGELYEPADELLAQVDVARQVPLLFQRGAVRLVDGTEAQAYLMSPDQVRGKRKLHHGDWLRRFASNVPRSAPGAFVTWARERFSRR